ncbi:MAG: hypothetical protein FJ100_23560 [Deltaproteobacteria bacterium]|nr:hypothetical protein [Deltaproteobacteria bacterium]
MEERKSNALRGAERELRIAKLERDIEKATAAHAASSDPVERAERKVELMKLTYALTTEKRGRSRSKRLRGQRKLPLSVDAPAKPAVQANGPAEQAGGTCVECRKHQAQIAHLLEGVKHFRAKWTEARDRRDALLREVHELTKKLKDAEIESGRRDSDGRLR